MVDTKFKKGLVPWNKGIPMSEKTRKKLSESKKGQASWSKGRKISERSGENHPMFGKHHSEESIKKMSQVKKGKMVGENNPFYGKTHSEETKKKISEAKKLMYSGGKIVHPMKGKKTGKPAWNRGIPASEEAKKNMSESQKRLYSEGKIIHSMKGKHPSEERIKKQREALMKTLSNPEVRKRLSEAQKKVWENNPELRKRQSEAHKGKNSGRDNYFYGKKHSEESLKKMSEAHKKTMSDPEVKKRISEAMKKRFETENVWNKGKKGVMPVPWNKDKKMPELSEWGRQNILKQYESGQFPRQQNTKPERTIKEELVKRGYKEGIDFIHQYRFMDKFMCDFCFPQQKVIVEVDGDFWHANPKKFPDQTKLHPHQIRGISKDKSKSAYISKVDNSSWTLIRIWESDINKDVAECLKKIEEVLAEKKKD